jgi:hypothetical protein
MKSFQTIASTNKIVSLEASKWLKIPLLLSFEEMVEVISLFQDSIFLLAGAVVKEGQWEVSKKTFLEAYGEYIEALKNGKFPDFYKIRPFFSSAITCDEKSAVRVSLQEGKEILKICRPVVQMQHHTLTYSEEDGHFRSQVFGAKAIPWGILFTYPQIVLGSMREILKVEDNCDFPNTKLFKALQKWQRDHTVPTPFVVGGKTVRVPARLGHDCFSWIQNHPSLNSQGISIFLKPKQSPNPYEN